MNILIVRLAQFCGIADFGERLIAKLDMMDRLEAEEAELLETSELPH